MISSQIVLNLLDFFLNYLCRHSKFQSIRKIVNIAGENGLSTWFSCLQLLAIAIILFYIYEEQKEKLWAFFGYFFLFLSIDEVAEIHERVGTTFKLEYLFNIARENEGFARTLMESYNSWGWHFLISPIYIIIGIVMFLWLWKRLDDNKQRLLLFTGLAMYAIALVIDYIEGIPNLVGEMHNKDSALDFYGLIHIIKSVEENLELLGSSFLIYSFHQRLSD